MIGYPSDMNTPDLEKIAKVLLWSVSGLQAEIATMKAQIDGVMDALGKKPSSEYLNQVEKETSALQMDLFREACLNARLNDEPPDTLKGVSRN